MKRVSSILLAVAIVLYCFTSCHFYTYASSSNNLGSVTIDDVLNFFRISDNHKSGSLEKRTEAARAFFFYLLCVDGFDFHSDNPSSDFFNSDGSFSDEFLKFYYEEYCRIPNASQVSGDIFMEEAGFDCNFKFEYISFMPTNFFTKGWDFFFKNYFTDFKNYYNSFLSRFLVYMGSSSVVDDPVPDKSGLDIAPAYIPSKEYKQQLQNDNLSYTVKSPVLKYGYRNCDWYQSIYKSNCRDSSIFDAIPFISDYAFPTKTTDCYLIFYYINGTDYFLSKRQFHFSITREDIFYPDRDEIESSTYNLVSAFWDNINETEDKAVSETFDISSYPYVNLFLSSNSNVFPVYFLNYSDFLQNKRNKLGFSSIKASTYNYISSDLLTEFKNYDVYSHFCKSYSEHDASCGFSGKCDIGYLISDTPIKTKYDFDIDKFPDDYVFKVDGGDTVNNYYITNPATGQTSTVNEYVTNNYTYITEAPDSGSEGGTGGDVVVGGQIDVNGSVDVNVNITGGNGVTVNPDDFTDENSVDLDKYYDKAVEEAAGVRGFMAKFFDFLPAELLGLLCLLVVAAIICRIFGR